MAYTFGSQSENLTPASADRFAQVPGTKFVVSCLCKNGKFDRYITSGIRDNGKIAHSDDRTRAQKFAKLTAEALVETLRAQYRITARVEVE